MKYKLKNISKFMQKNAKGVGLPAEVNNKALASRQLEDSVCSNNLRLENTKTAGVPTVQIHLSVYWWW